MVNLWVSQKIPLTNPQLETLTNPQLETSPKAGGSVFTATLCCARIKNPKRHRSHETCPENKMRCFRTGFARLTAVREVLDPEGRTYCLCYRE